MLPPSIPPFHCVQQQPNNRCYSPACAAPLNLHRLPVHLLEQQRLLEDQLLEHLLRQVVQLHGNAERLLGHRLISRIVILLQVRVCERLLHRVPVVRVECQHLAQQVQRAGVRLREELLPRHLWLVGQRLQVVAGLEKSN